MDEQTKEYTVSDTEATVETAVEDNTSVAEEEIIEKVIVKKKKKKKNKKYNIDDKTSRIILIVILIAGICIFCLSLFGLFTTTNKDNQDATVDETTTLASTLDNSLTPDNSSPDSTVPENQTDENADSNNASEDVNEQENEDANADSDTGNGASTPKSDEELLSMFNTAVNALKTDGPSFTKAKRTQTADIQLSNPLGQAYVSVAKDKYLSDDTVTTDVAKGDKASAVAIVSPDGEAYVSNLSMSDIKSISYTTTSDGNYEITINMPEATNPDLSSAYGRIFEFMLVDDVMDTYAPNMGATVDRENVSLVYSDCYAKAVITPEGKLVKYETKVNANMILKDAKVSVVTTDLDVTLFSDTSYTNIVW